jgi:glutamine amidotransferase
MKRADVAIIDYGVGNLLSVKRGFQHCGTVVNITADPDEIYNAARVVLPGVGAFSSAMSQLCQRGLDAVVKEVASRGTPLMGICLGMQMLLSQSLEFGVTQGLGLIDGEVIPIPSVDIKGQPQKTPQIGWNALVPPPEIDWQETILQDVKLGESVYFVHSFMANPVDPCHRVADYIYGGNLITAAIHKDNIYGCQFHPEKSGKVGLKILKRFCEN